MLKAIHIQDMIESLSDYALNSDITPAEMGAVLEKRCLEKLLASLGNNQCHVAARIGVHRNTIRRQISQLKIPIQKRWRVKKVA
jgi:DNA-binding protein Fis